jgi:hypothetical protein
MICILQTKYTNKVRISIQEYANKHKIVIVLQLLN